MLKPLVPKFRLHLSVRSKDIAEKQVPAKLKPIVVKYCWQYILYYRLQNIKFFVKLKSILCF